MNKLTKNTNTNHVLVFVVCSVIVLSLLILKLQVSVKSHIDMFDNDGYFKIYFFFIPVFRGKIHFEHNDVRSNNLVIEHKKAKQEIHLNADKRDDQSIVTLITTPLFTNVTVKRIDADIFVGKTNDAYFTTMILGAIRIAVCAVAAVIKTKHRMQINESFNPEFNRNCMEVDFLGILNFSIADIIYGLFLHIRKRREDKRKLLRREKI